jgi:hypothetical protein
MHETPAWKIPPCRLEIIRRITNHPPRCPTPYSDELKYSPCHVIDRRDMIANAGQIPDAVKFVKEYGKSNAEFLNSLHAPFQDDPYGEGRPMVLVRGPSGRKLPDTYHPRRGNSKLFKQYEKILDECGLSVNCITGKTQNVITEKGATPPMRNPTALSQCDKTYGLGFDTGMRSVPISAHPREVPDWSRSNENICAYIRHRCPSAFPSDYRRSMETQKRAHKKAAELASVLYLFFRAMLPAATIAEELKITADRVMMIAEDARRHYPLFIAGKCRCKNRGRANQWGKCRTAVATAA